MVTNAFIYATLSEIFVAADYLCICQTAGMMATFKGVRLL